MSTEREELAEPFLTREDVAEMLKVSTRTVDRYIDSGSLPASKVGRLVRVRRADFDAFTAPASPQL
ncbi:MAG: helix-turn-helix domain-containing protein, partial [Pseudolysinimonas sp.]